MEFLAFGHLDVSSLSTLIEGSKLMKEMHWANLTTSSETSSEIGSIDDKRIQKVMM